MALASLLGIRPGVTAVIGSGGKTTLLRHLGAELSREHRVLLCTTTHMFPFPDLPLADTPESLAALSARFSLLCAGTPEPGTGKLTAPPVPFSRLAAQFDYVLVEADGAARHPLKAHAPHEPVIPPEAHQVLLVVGASGLDRPVQESVHRPERFATLSGSRLASPEAVAAVLRAEALTQRVFINQADTPERLARSRRLAALLPWPSVIGSLHREEYEAVPCSGKIP